METLGKTIRLSIKKDMEPSTHTHRRRDLHGPGAGGYRSGAVVTDKLDECVCRSLELLNRALWQVLLQHNLRRNAGPGRGGGVRYRWCYFGIAVVVLWSCCAVEASGVASSQ